MYGKHLLKYLGFYIVELIQDEIIQLLGKNKFIVKKTNMKYNL